MAGDISTPDGLLIAGPDGEGLELSFRIARPGADPRANRISAPTYRAIAHGDGYAFLGRSVTGQLGIDVIADGDAYKHTTKDGKDYLRQPIDTRAHTEIGRLIVNDLQELGSKTPEGHLLTVNDQPVRFGRFVNFGRLNRLSKDEMVRATDDMLVSFGLENPTEPDAPKNYRINDDGSVDIKLSTVEFLINEVPLRESPETRFNAIRHGRAGLFPYMDSQERRPDDLLDDFLVGGIVMSSGPFYCKIRSDVGKFEQLESASFLDSNRMMGTRPSLSPYDRNRQVELVRRMKGSQTYEDTWVTVDFFRDTEVPNETDRLRNWYQLDLKERRRLHANGVNALDVINAAEPAKREALFDLAKGDDVSGVIISRQGITIAEGGKTMKHKAQNLLRAAISLGKEREFPRGMGWLNDIVKSLRHAGDRSRVAIATELAADDVVSLVERGDVRAFLIRDLTKGPMTKEDHAKLVDLVRKGVDIGSGGRFYRELHRSGMLVKGEQKEKLEEIDLAIAMYGGNRDEIGVALRDSIDKFFDDLTSFMPADRLGVVHGSAGGVMLSSDELARAKGMISMGIGIDIEKLDQVYNDNPDGMAKFGISDRLYRQQMLDTFNTISIFNVGGFGTLEELFVTVCTHKLKTCLPTPKIVVDESGLYEDSIKQVAKISDTKEIKVNGEVKDISDAPLGDRWVKNTLHSVDNYDEATEIIQEFYRDPAAYWSKAGIPKNAIEIALESHLERLELVGMTLPKNLERAARTYTGPEQD